eukprot:CAMPEP_0114580510 /NCGR_PEP_ID=MMETSP0125-20121206/4780_1 /TAXON_ID=485358 ORGANISM="Aristerostoma sp., Strain ATCC 50986" /NCGR_SAMPLE_ID=MMETSP0125 /ASSEMBLY_ACC=CAM_ASM_000245 /LENGTH=203 /DNA_ID=CAMNT_0001772113 /DNA_START=2027 /DNA_END=2638 /DNA_ORIENTATION=+
MLMSTPGKKRSDISSTFYNENYDRCKTEGGSDDDNVQKCWEDLLRNDGESDEIEDEEGGQSEQYVKNRFQYVEEVDNLEDGDYDREKEKIIRSFFKSKASVVNNDLIDVYEDEQGENDENLDDFEISEKFRNETLKLSNHTSSLPKTITSIQDKVKTTGLNTMMTTASTEIVHKPHVNQRNFGKFSGAAIKTPTSQSGGKLSF